MSHSPLELFPALQGDEGRRPHRPPLADRMRPRKLDEFVGQRHLLAPGRVLHRALEQQEVHSLIFWGPPGSGKTTLAHLIAARIQAHFEAFSAVLAGVKEIRAVVDAAKARRRRDGRGTILLVDEIHRFNKAQQDAFLPHVEDGTIILIGATTENPSFEVNAALLSRLRVYTLEALSDEDLAAILQRALRDAECGLGSEGVVLEEAAQGELIRLADGDARAALNLLELAAVTTPVAGDGLRRLTPEAIVRAAQRKTLLYDKVGEEHYNLISALHKSLRGGDPDASLYWLSRMLEAGEDPLYVARRLVRFASEDVGNADPQALSLCMAAMQAVHFIGLPEGKLALAQAAVYLALAPKSNALYVAYGQAAADATQERAEPVPLHLRNAPTRLMRELGYGTGYEYPHDAPEALVGQEFLPESLQGRRYYAPRGAGFEAELRRRLQAWRQGRARLQAARDQPGHAAPESSPPSPEAPTRRGAES
ncbi:MAG: replication-associated recombination protein A [Candidatus Tectomicrobia bacterium]|nr:replication-associated recombination protein A [Candidatus Tectomicrobia bacterium]